LPSYRPELNPDEFLNQDVKRHLRELHPRPADKPSLTKTLRRVLSPTPKATAPRRRLLQSAKRSLTPSPSRSH
jgi:hypothetical protein